MHDSFVSPHASPLPPLLTKLSASSPSLYHYRVIQVGPQRPHTTKHLPHTAHFPSTMINMHLKTCLTLSMLCLMHAAAGSAALGAAVLGCAPLCLHAGLPPPPQPARLPAETGHPLAPSLQATADFADFIVILGSSAIIGREMDGAGAGLEEEIEIYPSANNVTNLSN